MIDVMLAVTMFVSSFALGWAYVKYTDALIAKRRWRAANWGALRYAISCIGWIVAIKQGLWLLPFEAAGFYLSDVLAISKGDV